MIYLYLKKSLAMIASFCIISHCTKYRTIVITFVITEHELPQKKSKNRRNDKKISSLLHFIVVFIFILDSSCFLPPFASSFHFIYDH